MRGHDSVARRRNGGRAYRSMIRRTVGTWHSNVQNRGEQWEQQPYEVADSDWPDQSSFPCLCRGMASAGDLCSPTLGREG